MAVSRLDGRGFSLRRASPPPRKPGAAKHRSTAIPSPFLGSSAPLRSVTGALRADRLDPLHVEGLSPSGQRDTGGDVNPDCQDAFAPISFGWPHRWPPTPSVPAIDWFARPCFTRSRTPYQKPFPISPSTCVRPSDPTHSQARRRHARPVAFAAGTTGDGFLSSPSPLLAAADQCLGRPPDIHPAGTGISQQPFAPPGRPPVSRLPF
jgi:hypothetical protein